MSLERCILVVSLFLIVMAQLLGVQKALAKELLVITHPEWGGVFKKAGVAGTIILKVPGAKKLHLYNQKRAFEPRVPASTFKIINSLIAFEVGVVKDERQSFKWDGKPKWLKVWERDMTIGEAIAASNVPVYQRIASRIGGKRMQSYLSKLGYGNANIEGGITKFWLSGGLRISPIQQVAMLEKLYQMKLPVSVEGQKFVKMILPEMQGGCFTVRGKTGWAFKDDKPVHGWWVGWAEVAPENRRADRNDAASIFFALNADIRDKSLLKLRHSIVFEILHKYFKKNEKDCVQK